MGKNVLRVMLHAAAWLLIYLLPYYLIQGTVNLPQMAAEPGFVVHGLSTLLLIAYAYGNHHWLAPRLYLQRKYVLYAALVIAGFLLVIWFPNLFGGPKGDVRLHEAFREGGPPRGAPPGNGPPRGGPPSGILSKVNYNVLLFVVCTFGSISIRQQRQLHEAQKQKLDAELAFLKAQINPHFLFNTLNSIYALAIQKSDDIPAAIIQLSELMRYILKDSDTDEVAMDKEIGYINNYIALQKRRLRNTVKIDYSPPAGAVNGKVAPLILMSFVENAFKHGVNPDEESAISIAINMTEGCLQLKVENNKVASVTRHETMGIGLKNAGSRLQQLYPGRHRLTIDDNEKTFSVHLILELND